MLCTEAMGEGEVVLDLERVAGDVWCLSGQGGNLGVLATDEGLLVVDSSYRSVAPDVMKTIRAVSQEPIRYLIITHYHADHTGGAEVIGEDALIIMHPNCKATLTELHSQAGIEPSYAGGAREWTEGMVLQLGGETIHLLHHGNAHTAGDLIVVFEEAKVVHAGDLFFNGWPPYIDVENGSDTENWARTIERLCEQFSDHTFIPGHGEVTDAETFLELAGYLRFLRRQVATAIEEGKSREEAMETINLDAYSHLKDPRPGGGLTTNRNVGMVYDEMTRPTDPD
jgi:glyoxylase-like metal-dependent hydrolase (beta-lactamase superfamily II)